MTEYKFINDNIKRLFKNYQDIPVVLNLAKKFFGVEPELTIISQNHAFLLDVGGKKVKARFVNCDNFLHEKVLKESDANVPKVVGRIKRDNCIDLKFSEWIEGSTWKNQLATKTVYDEIPPKYYYQMGALLAKISNIKLDEIRYIGMSDIYWLNFILKEDEDQVYLTDTNKLYRTPFPEYFIFTQILFHDYTPVEHKEALVAGYHEFHVKRQDSQWLSTLQKMIEGML